MTVAREPVILAGALIGLIEYSDELDKQLRLRLAAFREGYAAGESAHADDYERGFADGVLSLKRAQHDAYRLVDLDAKRWELRGEKRSRTSFSQPHPGDYPGGAA